MRRLFRSLRVRLTVVVTLAVGLALAGASVALVTSMSRSLIGDVQDAAVARVDQVAEALRKGQPVTGVHVPVTNLTVIQVQDEQGRVVQQIPESPSGRVPSALPEDVRRAREQAQAEQHQGAQPTADSVVAWRTVSTPGGERTVLAVSRLGSVTQSIQLVVTSLLIATPLLTVFVGLLTWFAVDRALRPIESIRRRADVISHSTLGERLPDARTSDEVARLTTTLNEMLERLDQGARRQRQFVSDASHELRTPLAAMRADLEVSLAYRDGADWPGAARRLLEDHRRIERLTADLLELARLDEAAVPHLEPVRLDEIIAGELRTVQRAELGVSLEPAEVLGSEPELARMAHNLVENADRHATSRVDVNLAVRDGTAVLTVDDDGLGIPPEQRERVFDRFFRLDSSRARTNGGGGLGLAMVRRIIDSHSGEVHVGTAPLGGARFEIRLPAMEPFTHRAQEVTGRE